MVTKLIWKLAQPIDKKVKKATNSTPATNKFKSLQAYTITWPFAPSAIDQFNLKEATTYDNRIKEPI